MCDTRHGLEPGIRIRNRWQLKEWGRQRAPAARQLKASVLHKGALLTTGSNKGMRFSRAINEQILRTVKDSFKEVKSDKGLEMKTEAGLPPPGTAEVENSFGFCLARKN